MKLKNVDVENLKNIDVVLLPDFFVDHFLSLQDFDKTFVDVKKIYDQGGGNLPGVAQKIVSGGNASNTSLALAKLGISSHLICRTDKLGFHLLKYFLEPSGVDISHVKKDGHLSITTAFEFGEKHTNVMVGDIGSVKDFSFDILDENDLKLISESSMVCVLCWNLNRCGTDLACEVFNYAKKHNTLTFFDTGDPSSRSDEKNLLFNQVLSNNTLDILSLNENELNHFSNCNINPDDILYALSDLKHEIPCRVDLHTQNFSCSIKDDKIVVPSIKISHKYRSTGAGDTWNAGDIFGELLDFTTGERLLFANVVAGLYVSSSEPVHPSLPEIIDFLEKI